MNKAIYFVLGAAIGSVATYFITKSSFAKKADEEIKAVREYYTSKQEESKEGPGEAVQEESVQKLKPAMDSIIRNYANIPAPVKEEPKITPGNEPYIIDEKSFDALLETNDEYDDDDEEKYEILPSYRYFANGVLVNNKDEVVDMVTTAKFVGLGNLRQLALQDEDVIYVRNDVHKMVYEIYREEEDYDEPHAEG